MAEITVSVLMIFVIDAVPSWGPRRDDYRLLQPIENAHQDNGHQESDRAAKDLVRVLRHLSSRSCPTIRMQKSHSNTPLAKTPQDSYAETCGSINFAYGFLETVRDLQYETALAAVFPVRNGVAMAQHLQSGPLLLIRGGPCGIELDSQEDGLAHHDTIEPTLGD
ncbi:hypothetical protein SUNI508_13611 [Seiridium unicorne]|uniref:Uncharacterized protein n=1 Tax=Seiridium unicorne TaxID=138068 RepID=A0ABR2VCA2_9PEZI